MILSFESLRLAREARDRVVCAPAPPPVVSRIVGVTFKNYWFFELKYEHFQLNVSWLRSRTSTELTNRLGRSAAPPVVSRNATH